MDTSLLVPSTLQEVCSPAGPVQDSMVGGQDELA